VIGVQSTFFLLEKEKSCPNEAFLLEKENLRQKKIWCNYKKKGGKVLAAPCASFPAKAGKSAQNLNREAVLFAQIFCL